MIFQKTSALTPIPTDGITGIGLTPFSYEQNVTGTFTSKDLEIVLLTGNMQQQHCKLCQLVWPGQGWK